MRVSSPSKRARFLSDDTVPCWERILLDRVIFTGSIIRHLPRLEDRASLARTSRTYRRFSKKHDVVLRQMRRTWAVPSLSFATRLDMLFDSRLLPCIRWACDHQKNDIAMPSHLRAVAASGYMDGVYYMVSRTEDKNAVDDTLCALFYHKHVEKALSFYETHWKPLMGSGDTTYAACSSYSLRTCHPLADAHVRACIPEWTETLLREAGFKAGLLSKQADVIHYHLGYLTDVRQAISSLAKASHITRRNAYGKAFALEHALKNGISAEEFEGLWARGN